MISFRKNMIKYFLKNVRYFLLESDSVQEAKVSERVYLPHCQKPRVLRGSLRRIRSGIHGWVRTPDHSPGSLPGIQAGCDRTGDAPGSLPWPSPLLCSCFSPFRWRCVDSPGESQPCNRCIYPRYLWPCYGTDENRKRQQNGGIYPVCQRVRETKGKIKNSFWKFGRIQTSKAANIKRNPRIPELNRMRDSNLLNSVY